jgi:hypothetical protein
MRREGLSLFKQIPGSNSAVWSVALGVGHPGAVHADDLGIVRNGSTGNVNVPGIVVAHPNARRPYAHVENTGTSPGLARVSVDTSQVINALVNVERLCVAVALIAVNVALKHGSETHHLNRRNCED